MIDALLWPFRWLAGCMVWLVGFVIVGVLVAVAVAR